MFIEVDQTHCHPYMYTKETLLSHWIWLLPYVKGEISLSFVLYLSLGLFFSPLTNNNNNKTHLLLQYGLVFPFPHYNCILISITYSCSDMTPIKWSTSLGNHYSQDLQRPSPKRYPKSEESHAAANNHTGSGRSNSVSHRIQPPTAAKGASSETV